MAISLKVVSEKVKSAVDNKPEQSTAIVYPFPGSTNTGDAGRPHMEEKPTDTESIRRENALLREENARLKNELAAAKEMMQRQGIAPKTALPTLPDPDRDRDAYELWKDREDKSEKPLSFLRRVWGAYIDAGVMYQSDLRGSTTKKPLDKRLFDVCWRQCKDEGSDLNDCLPNKSKQVDREILDVKLDNLIKNQRVASLSSTFYRRMKKIKNKIEP
jgi:hypothetical protein